MIIHASRHYITVDADERSTFRLSPIFLRLDLLLPRRELGELGKEEGVLLDEGEELLELLRVRLRVLGLVLSCRMVDRSRRGVGRLVLRHGRVVHRHRRRRCRRLVLWHRLLVDVRDNHDGLLVQEVLLEEMVAEERRGALLGWVVHLAGDCDEGLLHLVVVVLAVAGWPDDPRRVLSGAWLVGCAVELREAVLLQLAVLAEEVSCEGDAEGAGLVNLAQGLGHEHAVGVLALDSHLKA